MAIKTHDSTVIFSGLTCPKNETAFMTMELYMIPYNFPLQRRPLFVMYGLRYMHSIIQFVRRVSTMNILCHAPEVQESGTYTNAINQFGISGWSCCSLMSLAKKIFPKGSHFGSKVKRKIRIAGHTRKIPSIRPHLTWLKKRSLDVRELPAISLLAVQLELLLLFLCRLPSLSLHVPLSLASSLLMSIAISGIPVMRSRSCR
mmetsp:Transcript_9509/g.13778  ORF Transcript_9509/g.13778 Transcript_9509/m.13778 type:complete len:202 (+) Transcript_9509:541-1146(+)